MSRKHLKNSRDMNPNVTNRNTSMAWQRRSNQTKKRAWARVSKQRKNPKKDTKHFWALLCWATSCKVLQEVKGVDPVRLGVFNLLAFLSSELWQTPAPALQTPLLSPLESVHSCQGTLAGLVYSPRVDQLDAPRCNWICPPSCEDNRWIFCLVVMPSTWPGSRHLESQDPAKLQSFLDQRNVHGSWGWVSHL